MRSFKRFKPGVQRRVHIFCSASLWSLIGIFLLLRGVEKLFVTGEWWLVVPGIGGGVLKSLLILDPSAKRSLDRIRHFSDNTCIGAVYSWKTWVLVLAMVLFGMVLRKSQVPDELIAVITIAIGWALVFSSRHGWSMWFSWRKSSD
ncbi:MAG: hypothetical protein D6B25_05165 [Desulfobulbaceae bacterium]|nr:MAG: hypothetical protein D6B25_05165 [Desulfobulbaceae bacterium]